MTIRSKEYYDLISKIPKKIPKENFLKNGKLIICLIEFRSMPEIEYVMNAILALYKPTEIGVAMIYGTNNAEYVEKLFKDWKGMHMIKTEHANLNRGTYSALCKTPEIWENFTNFSHVLVYQTDALLCNKIDEEYFQYDYIGAPWKSHFRIKNGFLGGNGGFSLRNVKKSIEVCEKYRNIPFEKKPRGNEDIFFCEQKSFLYPEVILSEKKPPIYLESHKRFSVEGVYYPEPIGMHQIFHCAMDSTKWNHLMKYITRQLIGDIDVDKKIPIDTTQKTMKEILPLKKEQRVASFVLENKRHAFCDKWIINCDNDYEILFCKNENHRSYVKSHYITKNTEACLHKKESGCRFYHEGDYIFIVFSPGFPDGGGSHADIQAPSGNHFNHARALPKNGAIILKSRKNYTINKELLLPDPEFRNLETPTLIFQLFSGVGYYNQLFSLELAIYLAYISKRKLVLNIEHPLVDKGRPDRNFGAITDYISNDFHKFLPLGIEVRLFKKSPKNLCTIPLPTKMSNIIFVDMDIDRKSKEINQDVKDFVHYRQEIPFSTLDPLFSKYQKAVYFEKSNASRFFQNFYTNQKNYKIMSEISFDLAKPTELIQEIYDQIITNFLSSENYVSMHLRFGDYHKNLTTVTSSNDKITHNLDTWMEQNAEYVKNKTFLIMTDRKDNPFFKEMEKTKKLIFLDTFISQKNKESLKSKFKNTSVAEFLIQKKICEYADLFIGSVGSTVSVHVQYMNYMNNKPYKKHTMANCGQLDPKTLEYVEDDTKNYTWKKQNFMGNHCVSWCKFFEDNIYKSPF